MMEKTPSKLHKNVVNQKFNYFANVICSVLAVSAAIYIMSEIPFCSCNFDMGISYTSVFEGIITQLQNKKSEGPYSFPCNFLKMLCHLVSPILATLINESFSSGIFPDKLKIARVITLHKKG